MEKSLFFVDNPAKIENKLRSLEKHVEILFEERNMVIAEGDMLITLINQLLKWNETYYNTDNNEKLQNEFLKLRDLFFIHFASFFCKFQKLKGKCLGYSHELIVLYFNREFLRKKYIDNKKIIEHSVEMVNTTETDIVTNFSNYSTDVLKQKQFDHQVWHQKMLTQAKNNSEIHYCLKVLDPILFSTFEQKQIILKQLEDDFNIELEKTKYDFFLQTVLNEFTEKEIQAMNPDMLKELKKNYNYMKTVMLEDVDENENSQSENQSENELDTNITTNTNTNINHLPTIKEVNEQVEKSEIISHNENTDNIVNAKINEDYCLAKEVKTIHHNKNREMIADCMLMQRNMYNLLKQFMIDETSRILHNQNNKYHPFYFKNSIFVPLNHNLNNESIEYFHTIMHLNECGIVDVSSSTFKRLPIQKTRKINILSNVCFILPWVLTCSVMITSWFLWK